MAYKPARDRQRGTSIHDSDRERRIARDSGQPGQSDRRGRRRPGGRVDGTGRRSLRSFDRQARGVGAARRRQEPLRRQGRAEGARSSQPRHFRRDFGPRRGRPAQDRRDDDRARRDEDEIETGGERDPRRFARRRQGGGGSLGPAALSLRRRNDGACPADAADEHRQWRRPCRQSDRLSGIHDPSGRRAVLRRRGPMGLGDVPRAQGRAEDGGAQHQCRRRGRLCAELCRRRKPRSTSA